MKQDRIALETRATKEIESEGSEERGAS